MKTSLGRHCGQTRRFAVSDFGARHIFAARGAEEFLAPVV